MVVVTVVVVVIVDVVVVVLVEQDPHKLGQNCLISNIEHWKAEKPLHSIGSLSHINVSQTLPIGLRKNWIFNYIY